MSRTFLPNWFALIGVGWILRDQRERIFRWLARLLDAPDAFDDIAPVVHLPRHVRRIAPNHPVFFNQEDDGGDAA